MKTINAADLKKRLEKNEILLIDVRTLSEHEQEFIEGSSLIPHNEIDVEDLPSLTKPIVLYCAIGKRSAYACAKLLEENPLLDVCSLEGGLNVWKDLGFPLKKVKTIILPLQQQVHIAVGFIAFLGTMLGAVINPIFYLLPGFMGLGLMFSGITGWCGMAKLLSKMPWNN